MTPGRLRRAHPRQLQRPTRYLNRLIQHLSRRRTRQPRRRRPTQQVVPLRHARPLLRIQSPPPGFQSQTHTKQRQLRHQSPPPRHVPPLPPHVSPGRLNFGRIPQRLRPLLQLPLPTRVPPVLSLLQFLPERSNARSNTFVRVPRIVNPRQEHLHVKLDRPDSPLHPASHPNLQVS